MRRSIRLGLDEAEFVAVQRMPAYPIEVALDRLGNDRASSASFISLGHGVKGRET